MCMCMSGPRVASSFCAVFKQARSATGPGGLNACLFAFHSPCSSTLHDPTRPRDFPLAPCSHCDAQDYGLPAPLGLLRADLHRHPFRGGCEEMLDAIVCDPPYGVRRSGTARGARGHQLESVAAGAVAREGAIKPRGGHRRMGALGDWCSRPQQEGPPEARAARHLRA